tara:strand:+ start:297 stop:509 length:213 start_codon:yes stop_codon:yes gene_type:complete
MLTEKEINDLGRIDTPYTVRAYRNHLLELSDSRVWPDHVPDAWRTHRQALRDVTAQAGFPETITWPVEPS